MGGLLDNFGGIYGLREDATQKGKGYFGELRRPDGSFSTELSFGPDDGVFGPLLVPTLTREQISGLLSLVPGQLPERETYFKAVDFARARMAAGLSPFAQEGEQMQYPAYTAPGSWGVFGWENK